MNWSKAVMIGLVLVVWVVAPCRADAFLFSSFRHNGEDGLHLAWSTDGLKWSALHDDQSFLKPEVGSEKLMRDPCLLQGPDGEFQIVWTTGWRGRDIGYAHSKDLIHWSAEQAIPVMEHEPQTLNCWAPEVVYDAPGRQYIIFWASTIPGRFPNTDQSGDHALNHRIYFTATKDFQRFTPAKVFFDPGFSVIDATILQGDGHYYLIFKDETAHPVPQKHLLIATGTRIDGPFEGWDKPFTPDWVEGPTAIKIGQWYYVYFDMYRAHHYGAMRSKDLKTWEDVSDQLSFPAGTRHGTVLRVDQGILENLKH